MHIELTVSVNTRVYRDDKGEFAVGIRFPYQDGEDWVCETFTEGEDYGNLLVYGVDALQAVRLAIQTLDNIISSRPNAGSLGITGPF